MKCSESATQHRLKAIADALANNTMDALAEQHENLREELIAGGVTGDWRLGERLLSWSGQPVPSWCQ
jgi:hypothetical protein